MTPLPPDRWPDVERLFAAACDSPDPEALLDGAEPALAAEVRALLAADHAAADVPLADLKTLIVEAHLDLFADDGDREAGLAPGTRVGPWVVEDEIGAGGMGVVYRARRADGVHAQAVALKVVRRGMDSAHVVRRFAQERTVLAGLDHPGIARLLDGGSVADGRPFLVLDLVPGEPITDYAARVRASAEARVRLILQVCEAVAHAHRRLVVHRDLKPSNILVADGEPGATGAEAAPRVTLLDFGVAHLLAPTLIGADADDAPLTADGPRPMTPGYAAPEQLAGAPVTTATDIYALGVVLYELLAGVRPYVGTACTADALARAIKAGPPARPSAAADPAVPARALRGDLDAVVMKALRPEPEQRYASVDALADDLRRHLDGRPVLARDGTARYVAGRFVRRHRWAIAAATAVVVALVSVAVLVSVQNRRVTRERDRAEQVASVLESVFLDIDPGGPGGASTTLRDVLDAGAGRIDTLDAQPAVQARLLDVVARVYRALADYDRALPLHRAAVAAATRAHGAEAPETLMARHHLAYLLDQMGRPADAERIYRAVLDARRRSGDPDGLVESLSDLSMLVQGAGRGAEAAALAQEGLRVLDRHPDAGPPDLEGPLSRAAFLSIIARHDEAQGRTDAAERALRESAAIYTRARGPEHTYTGVAESSLGSFLARRGRHAEADRLLRHAVAVQTAAWGPVHPWTTATLVARAEARARAGDVPAARALLADARRRAAGDSLAAAAVDRRAVRADSLLGALAGVSGPR
ncbi:MAG TPA: serine/threonine-protein kinase [Rubricoccaceae bacterium]